MPAMRVSVGDVFAQVMANLRANRLRTVLTMFGIGWGVVSVVVLTATGEGFQRGNETVLRELGRNIAIVWGGRTSAQAGGQRAGRRVHLTLDDARALARDPMVAVVSPEISRGALSVKSRYNAGALAVTGVEPQYQAIRTLDLDGGRLFREPDNDQGRRVAILGADVFAQLFGHRHGLGEVIQIQGHPYTVVGRLRKKDQDSNYSGPDNEKIFVPFAAMARDFPRTDVPDGVLSQIIATPVDSVLANLPAVLDARTGRVEDVDWPFARRIRQVLARQHGFETDDRDAVSIWDTSLESLMFERIIGSMKTFFFIVGLITLSLGGVGVMNIMLAAVGERTREIGLRRALGATARQVRLQFFLEGFVLTMLSGLIGLVTAIVLCLTVNMFPMPSRFEGMVITWQAGLGAVAALAAIGVVTSTYPASRAAGLPPVEALRADT